MKVEEIQEKMTSLLKSAEEITTLCEKEKRDLSEEEREKVKKLIDEAAELKKKLQEKKDDEDMKRQIQELMPSKEKAPEVIEGEKGTIGERFVSSKAFRAWMDSYGGRIPEKAKGINSPAIGYKTLLTGADDTSAGAMVFPEVKPTVLLPARPLTIRDLITIIPTSSDTVEYARVVSATNAAAGVGEATATSGSSGAKPESGITFEVVSDSVKTIAHWIPATKRALSDASQLRAIIDAFLRSGIEEELEDQIIAGGGGADLVGITSQGVQTQAFSTNLLETTRKAKTLVKVVGRATATAFLFNPYDWEKIDLLKNDEGNYYFGGPMAMGTPRLWGLPVVESEAVPEGTGYVGDFRQCVLWDREQASISVSDSHADFFIRNMVAILGEMRAAFGILRPAAIVEIDLTAGS